MHEEQFTATLNVKDAASVLKVAPVTIIRMVRDGMLPFTRIGRGRGRLRFKMADLLQYEANNAGRSYQRAT